MAIYPTITPTSITITPDQRIQFISNARLPVWSVDVGSITSTGFYTPPNTFNPFHAGNSLDAFVRVTDSVNQEIATCHVTISYAFINDTLRTLIEYLFLWPGSAAITTLGTITSGSIPASLLTGNIPVQSILLPVSQVVGIANSGVIDTTNAVNITTGLLSLDRLPSIPVSKLTGSLGGVISTPGISTLGGVRATSAVTHQFLTSVNTDGTLSQAQPSASDISGLAASATTDTTNAANITTGIFATAQIPTLAPSKITGLVASATTDTTNAANISSGVIPLARLPLVPVSQVTGLATSATTDTTNANNITTGTISVSLLPPIPANKIIGSTSSFSVLNKTSDYTVSTADGKQIFLLADATTALLTINLFTSIGNTGSNIAIKKVDGTVNTVTISAAANGQTIDGQSTITITRQYDSITMISDGANWFIL